MVSLKLGAFTTLIGMGGIFLVLIILSIVTILVAKLVDSKKRQQKESAQSVVAQPEPQPAPEQVLVVAQQSGISPKTVAAIMAAVTAASGSTGLKFTAIRRTGRINTVWTSASNMDIINSRQQYL